MRVLAPRAATPRLSRRLLLAGFAGAGLAGVAGCGRAGFAPSATSDGKVEDRLNIYSWGDYDDPETISLFDKRYGTQVQLDSYASNEEMVAKLGATRGTSGYDMVVPTGNYVPMMAKNNLLLPLDHAKLPNLANLDPAYADQPWDRGNTYTVCKNWGTTGFVYDNTKITRPMASWQDFLAAATQDASGSTALLDDPAEVTSIFFAANGIDLNTTKQADLDACEKYLVGTLAQHVRAFTSNPSQNITQDDFALMQAWNGDARFGILDSDEPKKWTYVFPTPTANLWMDNWAIAAGCQHPDSAYAFIDFLLRPDIGLREVEYIGYPTGLKDQKERAAKVERTDLVFPSAEVVSRLTPLEVGTSQQRIVAIVNAMQAKAGG